MFLDAFEHPVRGAFDSHGHEPHVGGGHRIGHRLRHAVAADVEVEEEVPVTERGDPVEEIEGPVRGGVELLAPEPHLANATLVQVSNLVDDVAGDRDR